MKMLRAEVVACVTDSEEDLERGKVYQVVADEVAAASGYLRVIDESGEDYLYPKIFFEMTARG